MCSNHWMNKSREFSLTYLITKYRLYEREKERERWKREKEMAYTLRSPRTVASVCVPWCIINHCLLFECMYTKAVCLCHVVY